MGGDTSLRSLCIGVAWWMLGESWVLLGWCWLILGCYLVDSKWIMGATRGWKKGGSWVLLGGCWVNYKCHRVGVWLLLGWVLVGVMV